MARSARFKSDRSSCHSSKIQPLYSLVGTLAMRTLKNQLLQAIKLPIFCVFGSRTFIASKSS